MYQIFVRTTVPSKFFLLDSPVTVLHMIAVSSIVVPSSLVEAWDIV